MQTEMKLAVRADIDGWFNDTCWFDLKKTSEQRGFYTAAPRAISRN